MSNWKSPLADVYGVDHVLGVNDGCSTAEQFAGIEPEYRAIRQSVAVSDNCHYGKFRISGADALDVINRLVMADIARLAIGRATWTFMLREDGSALCDVYVVCAGDEYLVFSEGSAPSEVLDVIQGQVNEASAKVEDLTASVALIGLDGPFAWELLKDLVGVRMLGLRYLEFLEKQSIGGAEVYVIRAGKTGEFGYQIMVAVADAAKVWQELLNAGQRFDVQAAGYKTLNVCRLENRFINMHREGAAVKNPLEMNCRVMIDREKDGYIGHEALQAAIESGIDGRVIGLKIEGNHDHVPEIGAEVSHDGQVYGRIVNAEFSPTLGSPVALAILAADVAYVGLDFTVNAGGANAPARTVSAPFIFNRSMTVRPQEDSYFAR